MNNQHLKIGIYYDGRYFYAVSNYYYYDHPRRSRLRVAGVHDFCRYYLSLQYKLPFDNCSISESHYYRHRLIAKDRSNIHKDIGFENTLLRLGVSTHVIPYASSDCASYLSLECYDHALHNRFDVCVLAVGSSTYTPLVHKLLALGKAVFILSWNLPKNRNHSVSVSPSLLNAASGIAVNDIIDDPSTISGIGPYITNMFLNNDHDADAACVAA